jgi:hypothetical protein
MSTPFSPVAGGLDHLEPATPGTQCQHEYPSGRRCQEEADYRVRDRPPQGPERERVFCEGHVRVSS